MKLLCVGLIFCFTVGGVAGLMMTALYWNYL